MHLSTMNLWRTGFFDEHVATHEPTSICLHLDIRLGTDAHEIVKRCRVLINFIPGQAWEAD